MSKVKVNVDWFADPIVERIIDEGKKALMESGLDLQQISSEEAPIELGDLRGNAAVDDSELDSKGTIRVGYNLPYAMKQHEELSYNHPIGGKAKYLEDPFNANKDKYKKHIAKAVDEASD